MNTPPQPFAPHAFSTLVSHNEVMRQLLVEAARQKHCLVCVLACLPEDWQAHCIAARVTEDTLVVFVDQPSWAVRFRFQSERLCQAVRAETPRVCRLRVRVSVTHAQRPATPKVARVRLPRQQLNLWRVAAGLQPRDPISGNKPARN